MGAGVGTDIYLKELGRAGRLEILQVLKLQSWFQDPVLASAMGCHLHEEGQ